MSDPLNILKTVFLSYWYIFLLFVIFIIFINFLKSKHFKGWSGEKATSVSLNLNLDLEVYRIFNDFIIPDTGGSTQIDHVVLSRYGIFVIEVKNYSGWIFGNEKNPQWTQIIHRTKNRFQNPLRQNYRHIKALSNFLKLEEIYFYSVVFFIGDSVFKTKMPSNVINNNLSGYIESFRAPILSLGKLERAVESLHKLKDNPLISKKDHIETLKQKHTEGGLKARKTKI
jgi:hypothetical protein